MGNLDFNTDEHAPISMDYSPIPDGWYQVHATASDVNPNKDGTGLILKMTFEVLEGEHKGRKVFTNFNIKNQSQKAEQIALGMLSALCKAAGKTGLVEESYELHEIPVMIKVTTVESPGYAPKNEIKSFKPVGKVEATKAATPATAAAADTDDISW